MDVKPFLSFLLLCGCHLVSAVKIDRIDDDTKIDICHPLNLRFLIRRVDNNMWHETVEMTGTMPLLVVEEDAVFSHNWVNVSDMAPEMEFFSLNKDFIMRYYNETVEEPSTFDLAYECQFDPFRCTIRHFWDGNEFMTFENGSVTVHRTYVLHTNVTQDALKKYANGTGVEVLQENAERLKEKWLGICNETVVLDDVRKNYYIMRENVGVNVLECQMISEIPLQYHMKIHTPRLNVSVATTDIIGMTKVVSFLQVRPDELSDVTCEIKASTGWTIALKYTPPERLPLASPLSSRRHRDADFFQDHLPMSRRTIILSIVLGVVVSFSVGVVIFGLHRWGKRIHCYNRLESRFVITAGYVKRSDSADDIAEIIIEEE